MMNEFQRRILAEAAKYGGKVISQNDKMANTMNEAPAMSPSAVTSMFGYSKPQFEAKMRQLIQKMGFEKGITKMEIADRKMVMHFANAAKARDFVITFNGLTKRSSKGQSASVSTSFDKTKAPAGTAAIVTVDFTMLKTEGLDKESHLFLMLESLHEQYLTEGGVKAAIEDFMYDMLTKQAIAELKPIMKNQSIRGSQLRDKVNAVLKKHKIPLMHLGGSSAQLVIDYFDTFHGESVEENTQEGVEQVINESNGREFAKFVIGRYRVSLSVDPKNPKVILSKSRVGTQTIRHSDFVEFFTRFPVDTYSDKPKAHYVMNYSDGGYEFAWLIGPGWQKMFLGKVVGLKGGTVEYIWGQTGMDTKKFMPTARRDSDWRKAVLNGYQNALKEEVVESDEENEVEVVEAFRFRQQDWENMRAKYKQGTPVNITLRGGRTVSGILLRIDKYDQGFSTKGHLLIVKTIKGNVRVDDVDVKSIHWNNDPKTKMSEETNLEEAKIPKGFKKGEMLWLPGTNKRGQLIRWEPVDGVVGGMFTLVLPDKTVRHIKAQEIFRANSTKLLTKKEEVEVAEQFKTGDKVKVPHKGKMVSGKIVRFDSGGTDKARQHGGGYVVDVGEPASILVPKQKVQKEEVEHIEEAYAPLDTPNLVGAFTETTKKKRFEYRKSTDKWGISHGLPHEVCVKEISPSEWRAANVKGTVCYIATDEGEGGKPVLEKWAIRNHVKYVKAEETDQEGEVIEEDRMAVQGSKMVYVGQTLRALQSKSMMSGSVVKGERYKVATNKSGKVDLVHQSMGYRTAVRNVDATTIEALIKNKVLI